MELSSRSFPLSPAVVPVLPDYLFCCPVEPRTSGTSYEYQSLHNHGLRLRIDLGTFHIYRQAEVNIVGDLDDPDDGSITA